MPGLAAGIHKGLDVGTNLALKKQDLDIARARLEISARMQDRADEQFAFDVKKHRVSNVFKKITNYESQVERIRTSPGADEPGQQDKLRLLEQAIGEGYGELDMMFPGLPKETGLMEGTPGTEGLASLPAEMYYTNTPEKQIATARNVYNQKLETEHHYKALLEQVKALHRKPESYRSSKAGVDALIQGRKDVAGMKDKRTSLQKNAEAAGFGNVKEWLKWKAENKGGSEKAKEKQLSDVKTNFFKQLNQYYSAKRGVGQFIEDPNKELIAKEARQRAKYLATQYKDLGGDLKDLGIAETEETDKTQIDAPVFKTAEDVRTAYQAGKISKEAAKKILMENF